MATCFVGAGRRIHAQFSCPAKHESGLAAPETAVTHEAYSSPIRILANKVSSPSSRNAEVLILGLTVHISQSLRRKAGNVARHVRVSLGCEFSFSFGFG